MSTEKYHKTQLGGNVARDSYLVQREISRSQIDYAPSDFFFSTLPGPFTVCFTTGSPW